MPFHLEKGPIFATLESVYNDPALLPGFLHDLWKGKALGDHGVLTSTLYDDKTNLQSANADGTKRLKSMRVSWFGDDEDGNEQPEFGQPPEKKLTTGYWALYHGNVREIVAKTLMSAGEVALGVNRPPPPPPTPAPPSASRYWPVEFFWKCGQPRFEGWVTWREHGDSGQVTVIFATPATPDQVLRQPGAGADLVTDDAWKKWQGMWVTTHENHKQHVMITSMPTAAGNWLVPISAVMFTEGDGNVRTWAPRFFEGGAAKEQLEFVPGEEL